MLEIKSKLKVPRAAYRVEVKGRLELAFDARQKTRLRAVLDSGEEVALVLPRGETLRGGDLLVASDGRVIELAARPEQVVHITCSTPRDLARAAYHLGNRHVPVEVGEGWLRIAADHVLEEMLRGLGAVLEAREAPFEPEAGAYGGHGHHQHEEREHAGRIHQYGDAGHAHDHGHGHGHGHGHDHDHGHGHDHDHDHDHDHGHDHSHDHHGHGHKRK